MKLSIVFEVFNALFVFPFYEWPAYIFWIHFCIMLLALQFLEIFFVQSRNQMLAVIQIEVSYGLPLLKNYFYDIICHVKFFNFEVAKLISPFSHDFFFLCPLKDLPTQGHACTCKTFMFLSHLQDSNPIGICFVASMKYSYILFFSNGYSLDLTPFVK